MMIKMGEQIRQMRDERHWTQEDLAEMCQTGEKYISALERGKRKPGPKLITELCNAFCVSEQELRFGKQQDNGISNDEDRRIAPLKRLIFAELDPLTESEQAEVLKTILEMKEVRKKSLT